MFFLFLTLNRFFLPSRYRLDAGTASLSAIPVGSRSLRWKDLRRFPHDQVGGYLSTRIRRSMFDTRGISVLFGRHGGEIIPQDQILHGVESMSWREQFKHAFAMEKGAVEPNDRQMELVDKVCKAVVRRGTDRSGPDGIWK